MRMTFYGERLLKLSGEKNPHSLSLKARVSYPTVMRYVQTDGIRSIDLDVISALLSDGCGLTADQVREMRIGDLFEVQK